MAHAMFVLLLPGLVGAVSPKGCSTESVGTCAYMGCNTLRGPLSCVKGKCLCNSGYCADINKVFNTCRANVGTCSAGKCSQKTKAGAAIDECVSGNCLCHSGYILDAKNPKMCVDGKSGLGAMVSSGLNAYSQVKDAAGAIKDAGAAALKGDFSGALAKGKDAVGKVSKAVGGVTEAIGAAKNVYTKGAAAVKDAIGTVSKAVKDMDLQGTWDTIKKTGGTVMNAAKGIAKAGSAVMGCVGGEKSCSDAWGEVQNAYKGVQGAVSSVKDTYGKVKGKAMIGYNAAQGLHNKYLTGGRVFGGGRGGGGGKKGLAGSAFMGRLKNGIKKKYGSQLKKRGGGARKKFNMASFRSKFKAGFAKKYGSRLKKRGGSKRKSKFNMGAFKKKFGKNLKKKFGYNKRKSFYKNSRKTSVRR